MLHVRAGGASAGGDTAGAGGEAEGDRAQEEGGGAGAARRAASAGGGEATRARAGKSAELAFLRTVQLHSAAAWAAGALVQRNAVL